MSSPTGTRVQSSFSVYTIVFLKLTNHIREQRPPAGRIEIRSRRFPPSHRRSPHTSTNQLRNEGKPIAEDLVVAEVKTSSLRVDFRRRDPAHSNGASQGADLIAAIVLSLLLHHSHCRVRNITLHI